MTVGGGALWHPWHMEWGPWGGDLGRLWNKSPRTKSVCRLFVIAHVGRLSSEANIMAEARPDNRAPSPCSAGLQPALQGPGALPSLHFLAETPPHSFSLGPCTPSFRVQHSSISFCSPTCLPPDCSLCSLFLIFSTPLLPAQSAVISVSPPSLSDDHPFYSTLSPRCPAISRESFHDVAPFFCY